MELARVWHLSGLLGKGLSPSWKLGGVLSSWGMYRPGDSGSTGTQARTDGTAAFVITCDNVRHWTLPRSHRTMGELRHVIAGTCARWHEGTEASGPQPHGGQEAVWRAGRTQLRPSRGVRTPDSSVLGGRTDEPAGSRALGAGAACPVCMIVTWACLHYGHCPPQPSNKERVHVR